MGGATSTPLAFAHSCRGLSPRGRGNLHIHRRTDLLRGSIPAWAGQPRVCSRSGPQYRVYPRVGGATGWRSQCSVSPEGLSPRGRGNPNLGHFGRPPPGSIPAWAGQPRDGAGLDRGVRVYPRVGGATHRSIRTANQCSGLSPRGRGNPLSSPSRNITVRSIPAWAGQPYPLGAESMQATVYPRVGGATHASITVKAGSRGLSPRGRGNRSRCSRSKRPWRSIPAWAGQPFSGLNLDKSSWVYPRVGGATHNLAVIEGVEWGLSPRGRGNRSNASS